MVTVYFFNRVKMNRTGIFLFAILCFFHGGYGQSNQGKGQSLSVTDFRGKTVTLSSPAKRIVCLIESGLTGLYMLGAQNAVVAVPTSAYRESAASQYAALDERIKSHSLSTPGNWDFINIESVVALSPDLVILWSQQTESIQSLEQKGLSVYGVFLSRFDDVYKEIRDFGILTGTSPRAEKLIRYTKEEIGRFSAKPVSTTVKRPSVYYMWAQGPLETSGTKSTVNELLELSGAVNVCRSPQEHLVVNAETVIGWNPEVIIMWYNQEKSPADIMAMAMWRNLSAVKNHRVFELPSVFYCDLWTLKFQYAVKMVAAWCYPDRFKTFDLEGERRSMLDTLYGPLGSHLYNDK